MSIDVKSDRLAKVLDPETEVEQIIWGCWFTEGPIWSPEGQYLLFSDVPANTRRRWDERDGYKRVVARPTNKANGMTRDADGRLIVCEHETSVVVRMDADGTGSGREVLASHYGDKELNSPNDLAVASDGSIYFTDPPSGRDDPDHGLERPMQLDFKGVFRIPPGGGDTQLLVDDFHTPNGLCFSPDESLLYVVDTIRTQIRVFDVQSDGLLANGRIFADNIGKWDDVWGPKRGGIVDGMKCDAEGNIYVTGPGGIWVFSADGEHLGVVHTPNSVGNLNWGGPDWDWMYVAASSGVLRFRTRIPARREPYMK